MMPISIAAGRVLHVFTFIALVWSHAASASPGAHGPNGEHLDSAQKGPTASQTAPRLEAKSELFEAVARLDREELSILIDRYDSNEPVLKASVEVESGSVKAKATFHSDIGDYAVDDPAMLKLLSTAGEHPVVITIVAGQDSDLLEGVLQVVPTEALSVSSHDHIRELALWGALAAGVLLLLSIVVRKRLSRKRLSPTINPIQGEIA